MSVLGPTWLVDDLLRIEDLLLRTAGASPHPLVSEPAMHLIQAGGKRLRPALVVLTARAGTAGSDATDLAAAAIELVHLATLYHDDVIDETETRRGVPTTHAKWGIEIAVLAGDYLFARGCGLAAQAGGEVPGILAHAIADVCEGQIVETAATGDPRRSIDDYLDTVRKKTAALFRAACELGAATAGVSGRARDALVRYGDELGMAFQIVDDVLDLVGDPEITGKRPGTDLREGVFTLPVLVGAQRDPTLPALLARGTPDLDEVMPSLTASGAITAALGEARARAETATRALDGLPETEWAEVLRTIATGVLAQVEV